jgi:Zn-dependent metalloprotease
MFRNRALTTSGLFLALALAACSSHDDDNGPTRTPQSNEMAAVSLGVTIVSKNDRGAPRLVRAVIPRPAKQGATVEDAARDHLAALKSLYLTRQQPADLVTAGTQKLRDGAAVVRLQQKIDGVDIHQGELRVLMHADGSLAAVSGTMLATAGKTTFKTSPTTALQHALDDLYGKTRARPAITEGAAKDGFVDLKVAADPKVSIRTARAKQELFPDGNGLVPVWTVEFIGLKPALDGSTPTAHRYLISDKDGRIVRNADLIQNDAFVYRAFSDMTGNRRPFDGATKSFNPHPTGTPDGSLPGFAGSNLVTIDSFNANHDPWLPATATTTSGNNVDAFADIAFPSGFSEGDIRPEVRSGRILNYTYDLNKGPLDNVTQSKAATVNSFFVTNWLHDWWYDSGFTEATGNAQLDNLGRGGVAGDPLILHAQDDALGGSRDNAFMVTPADGLSPEMHMFLWTGGSTSSIDAVTGHPTTATFRTGPTTFDFTGTVALADNVGLDGTSVVHDACSPVTTDLTGKIGMFEFDGNCGSVTAVDNLKAAGAVGVLAAITIPDVPVQSLNGSAAANIPGLIVGNDDGLALEAVLPTTITLHRATHLETDGDLDNAVVAHEWGHYLHHRLTSCEATNQCAAMSEGWGDFNAMLMMLRTGDNHDGTFGMGLYALTAGGLAQFGFTDPGYFGIRRVAYSTNRSANSLSFRHIGDENALPTDIPLNPGPSGGANSEVHNAGEVWATMMWEAYNALIDQHGILNSRRRMSDYVVAGMLLTPPEATFTEARDAILAAAGALDTDDMILMAAAFAGRGAGSCAVSPDRASFDNAGVVESGTLAAKLEASAATLTDDGASCDHDGILDPGESGTIHITVANSGVLSAENVKIKAKSNTPGVKVGKTVKVGLLQPFSSADLAIPVTIGKDAAVDSNLDITVTVTGDAGCDTNNLALNIHQRMGIDEAENVETTDHVETSVTPWQRTGEGGDTTFSIVDDGTGNHAWFGVDSPFTSDTQLLSPVLQVGTDPLTVTFSHAFDLEAFAPDFFFDGGVVEVSTDGGVTFQDVTAFGADPQYNGTISSDFDNPLLGRPAYSSTNASFPSSENVVLNFGTQFAGQSVQLRFRIGTDFCCNAEGWLIDDIAVTGITNTPFPGIIPEPDVCTLGGGSLSGGGVAGTKTAPHETLKPIAPDGDE